MKDYLKATFFIIFFEIMLTKYSSYYLKVGQSFSLQIKQRFFQKHTIEILIFPSINGLKNMEMGQMQTGFL